MITSLDLLSSRSASKVVLNPKTYFVKLAKNFLIAPSKFQVMGGVGILSLLINLPVFWFINNRDLNCDDQLRLILITIPTVVMRLIIPMLALTIFSCLTVRKVHFLTFPACYPITFWNLNYKCSIIIDLRNLQEQINKALWPFTFQINCSSDLKIKFSAFSLKSQKFFSITRTFFPTKGLGFGFPGPF